VTGPRSTPLANHPLRGSNTVVNESAATQAARVRQARRWFATERDSAVEPISADTRLWI
jgi:hypothetical protein